MPIESVAVFLEKLNKQLFRLPIMAYHGHQSIHFNFWVSIVLTERRAESSYWVFISRKYWSLKWRRRELLVLHCQRDRRTGGVLFVLIWQLQWDWGHGTVLATNHQSSLEAGHSPSTLLWDTEIEIYTSTHTGHNLHHTTTIILWNIRI